MSEARPTILLLDGKRRGHFYEEIRGAMDAEWLIGDTGEPVAAKAEDIDLTINNGEYNASVSAAVREYARHGVPSLHIVDGILEWRSTWENPRTASQERGMPLFQPVLSDKIACLGRSQVRILESWGNLGRCEIVGAPRFDRLLGRRPRGRRPEEAFRVLVMTAKTPGFTPRQVEMVRRGLKDLGRWFAQNPEIAGTRIEPVWRLTGKLPEEIGVASDASDFTGKQLAEVLELVDAVVTTPSTAMLEAMLQGVPVALLDYNNRPHYVPAAWSMAAADHIGKVMPEFLDPPPARMLYQDTVLHDVLECRSPATPRMVRLIKTLIAIGRECCTHRGPIELPRRILSDPQNAHHLPEEAFDLRRLYPHHPVFAEMGRVRLQAELGYLVMRVARADRDSAELKRAVAERDRYKAALQAVLDRAPVRVCRALKRWLASLVGRRPGENSEAADRSQSA